MQQAAGSAAMQKSFTRRKAGGDLGYSDVEVDLARLVFINVIPTILQGAFCFVGLSAFLAHHYGDRWFARMAVFTLCASTARFATAAGFLRRDGPMLTIREAWAWQRAFGLCSFVHYSTLAASTVYCFSHHDIGSWAICGTGVFAVSANQAGREGLRPAIALAGTLVMQLALAGSLLACPDLLVRLAGMLTLIFSLFHCVAVRRQFAAVVEQIRSRRKLIQLAEQDTLTGLVNRRHLEAALTLACQQAARPFAILYIDLDRFKAVNDTFGHHTGDILLNRVAGRLRRSVRATDLVARIGGDEFCILQKAVVSMEDAQALAARIVIEISSVFEIEGNQIQIGASVGIRLSTESDRDPRLLLANADSALYRVKQSGGGSFSFTEGQIAGVEG